MDEEVKFDQRAFMQHLKNKVIVDFVSALMPDEKTRKLTQAIVAVHRKYGIDAATSMQIMLELGTVIKEVEDAYDGT